MLPGKKHERRSMWEILGSPTGLNMVAEPRRLRLLCPAGFFVPPLSALFLYGIGCLTYAG
jgi:hypothetical protein